MNFKIKADESLQNILSKLAAITGSEPLAVDIEKGAKFLQNPLSLKIFKGLAQEKKLPLELSYNGKPLEENERKQEETPTPPKIPNLTSIFKKKGLLVFGGVLLTLAALGAIFYFLPHATIEIQVENEVLSKGVDVIASPSAENVTLEKRIIPSQVLSFTEKVTKEIDTTGKKAVGEKAKGIVTVYNKTDAEKALTAGTKLYKISAEGANLEYVTQADITVPARIATISTELVTYVSGKKDVAVEAADISEKYNLSQGEELSVESYSTNLYVGRTNDGLSGGTSKTVPVVTETDEKNALESAAVDLKFKASDAFKQLSGQGQYFDDKAVYESDRKSVLNFKVGEEAQKLKVEETISFKALVFYQSDLQNLMESLAQEFVPANFTLSNESKDISIEALALEENPETKTNTLKFTAKFHGLVVPEVDENTVIKNIAGKTYDVAETFLEKQIPKARGFNIIFSPNLPAPFNRLPLRERNIRVEIKSD